MSTGRTGSITISPTTFPGTRAAIARRSEPVTDNRTGSLGAVGRFFFSPTDPTTLGFMRIMTGLILLYVHATYCIELKSFFGPDAWWDQPAANRQRRQQPNVPPPLGWYVIEPSIHLEGSWDYPHRRAAIKEIFCHPPSPPGGPETKTRLPGRWCPQDPK